MSHRLLRFALIAAVLFYAPSRAYAAPILIDFESLSEGTDVGSLLGPALTFSNATVLTAGTSLNEIEFPPTSGANVVYDSGSPLRIDFAGGISSFSAYFTYIAPLTIQFFDASGLLGSTTSSFDFNFGSSGNAPNELLGGAFASISYVTISGFSLGGSFVMDDLTFEPAAATPPPPIPEPSTLVLLGSGVLALVKARNRGAGRRVPTM